MTGREKAAAGIAAVLALGITGYSAWTLVGKGILSWHAAQPEFHSMMAELAAVWLILFLIFFFGRRGSIWCGAAAVILAYCWLHVIFLPVVFAAGYTGYLILTGAWFRKSVMRAGREAGGKGWLCWDFMLGSAVTIAEFCLLSLGNQGSIKKLRLWVLACGVILAGRWIWERGKADTVCGGRAPGRQRGRGLRQLCGGQAEQICRAAMMASIVALVLLQAGRMNLAVDFDSIWYGVRSHVMLDSGNGIYEDLGTLGVVYTYPKGFETLTLPLAGLPSYSFMIAFNGIAAAMTLLAAYETAAVCVEKTYALWVPFLMAAVPGIMNMADTAKADLMTLFCQILMLQGVMRYLESWYDGAADGAGVERTDGSKKLTGSGWLALALAAGGVSLTMKPTAVIFSTAIVGMSLFWILWEWFRGRLHGKDGAADAVLQEQNGGQPEKCVFEGSGRSWLAVALAAAAGVGIWGRTMKLVGVPVTSVFYQVFQKMGFRVKYPFYASGFPAAGGGMSFGEKLRFLAGRVYGVLLNPQGDDMGHVIIAWGTVLPVVIAIMIVCFGRNGRAVRRILRYLAVMLAALLFIDLVSLYSLSQIDGNYYMLTYAVLIIFGCIWLAECGSFGKKSAYALLIPVWLYGVMLCGLTNWAWALGNGGIQAVNKGYYSHAAAEREKRAAQGSQAIWEIFAANPRNRVIALGEHPGVLTFPCWVQSYVDVSGYWGNPEVVADAPAFLRYLQFAGVDYLYMEKEYIDTSVRIYQIVRTLVEQGWLYDVRDENGNLVLSVRKESADAFQAGTEITDEEVQKNLWIFDHQYIQHP